MFRASHASALRWTLVSTLLVGQSCLLFAQSERGTISGTVRDSTGAVIPGAKVVVTNTATGLVENLSSNQVGEFTGVSLPVGPYKVQVSKEGFRPAEIQGLAVDAATNARADVTLEVGQSTQAVEVQASAVQLHAEDAKTSVTINQKLVDTLPLVVGGTVRSPFDLASLTPEAKNLRRRRRFRFRWRSGSELRRHARRRFGQHFARVTKKLGDFQRAFR